MAKPRAHLIPRIIGELLTPFYRWIHRGIGMLLVYSPTADKWRSWDLHFTDVFFKEGRIRRWFLL